MDNIAIELKALAVRLRKLTVVTGRDEHTVEYADGYENACEMAADEIESILSDAAGDR